MPASPQGLEEFFPPRPLDLWQDDSCSLVGSSVGILWFSCSFVHYFLGKRGQATISPTSEDFAIPKRPPTPNSLASHPGHWEPLPGTLAG